MLWIVQYLKKKNTTITHIGWDIGSLPCTIYKKKKNSLYKAKEYAPFFLDKKKCFYVLVCVCLPHHPFSFPRLLFFISLSQILRSFFLCSFCHFVRFLWKKKPLHTLAEPFLSTVMMSSLSRSVLCNFKKKTTKKTYTKACTRHRLAALFLGIVCVNLVNCLVKNE